MSLVLEVSNISKSFQDYSSEWKRVLSWFGFKFQPKEEHQILKGISFTIASGEAVGIVGQNGAGKSTLLKIITGTLKPTTGAVTVAGRISAILELGMGFHPDLTGKQNVYHSAGLMGFTQEQIDAVIGDIEAFTEIEEYFNQPVRTYSSGMKMRVAFAVATAYRPEILIVDEALSVGDAYFQHKSFDRIRKFQEEGTTLLIVSHDRGAIQSICDRAILLEGGTVLKDGKPEEIIDYYNALIAQKENSKITQITQEDGNIQTISGTGEASILDISLYNKKGESIEYIGVGESITLRIKVEAYKEIPKLVIGYLIKNRLGQEIFGTNTYHHNEIVMDASVGDILEFDFDFDMNLGVGSYSIAVAAHGHDTHIDANYEWRDQALVFHVINTEHKEFIGSSWIAPEIKVNNVR